MRGGISYSVDLHLPPSCFCGLPHIYIQCKPNVRLTLTLCVHLGSYIYSGIPGKHKVRLTVTHNVIIMCETHSVTQCKPNDRHTM